MAITRDRTTTANRAHRTPKNGVTLKDAAARAGVSVSLVSKALNNARGPVRMADETRRRVLAAAREIGYQPHAVARALVTKRTGFLGFILSDDIADAWSNAVFSQVLSGVEAACREGGYALAVSRYNLSDLDSFIVPPKVGQRSVDALVLTGHVEAAVVQRFCEFGIPCVCVGDNVDAANLIPTVACDFVDGMFQAVLAAAERGHVHMWFCNDQTPRGKEAGRLLCGRTQAQPRTRPCGVELVRIPDNGHGNYGDAAPLLECFLARPRDDRPSVILAPDQVLVAMQPLLREHGLACPRDVSLISTCDSRLCEFAAPPIASLSYDMSAYGRTAARMLIEHLDNAAPLTAEMSRLEPCDVIVRESLGPVPMCERGHR